MLSFGLTHGMSYVLQLVFLDTCMKEGSKQVIYNLIFFLVVPWETRSWTL